MKWTQSWGRVLGCLFVGFLAIAAVPAEAALREVGATAPDFSLQTLDGDSITLSELRGKPVVLEFWATWCGHCRRQLPKMAEMHEKYGDRVHFLLVNTAESRAAVRAFGEKLKIPGTVLMDPEDRVGELYGTRILPSLFFIDAEGKIRAAEAGALEDVEALLTGLVSSS